MSLNSAVVLRETTKRWALSHWGLASLLVLSMALNALLTWRAIYWRHRVQESEVRQADAGGPQAGPGAPERRPEPLPVGQTLPALKGKHLDASDAVVEFQRPGPPTLLYFMSPSCIWCTRNSPNLRALVEQRKGKYRVLVVSASDDGLRDYAAKNGLAAPNVELLFGVPSDVLRTQGLTGTPQALLISPEGKLVKRWQGAFVATQADIEATLGVHLPGLAD